MAEFIRFFQLRKRVDSIAISRQDLAVPHEQTHKKTWFFGPLSLLPRPEKSLLYRLGYRSVYVQGIPMAPGIGSLPLLAGGGD